MQHSMQLVFGSCLPWVQSPWLRSGRWSPSRSPCKKGCRDHGGAWVLPALPQAYWVTLGQSFSSQGLSIPVEYPVLSPLHLLILWVPAVPGVPDAPANQGEMTQGSPRILPGRVASLRLEGEGWGGVWGAGSGDAPRVRAGETRRGYLPRSSCKAGPFKF
jgi:hypothetical protein